MYRIIIASLVLLLCTNSRAYSQFSRAEISRWNSTAKNVQIIRDNFGVPHVYGKTDADAVFGLMYSQCEDDFPRIERNYIEKLGRMSEIKGGSFIFKDLYIRLVIDSSEAIHDFKTAPAWLKKLLIAYADGINFYLAKHPDVRPELLERFEPWFPLLWTDGSIGAISTGNLTAVHLERFYNGQDLAFEPPQAFPEVQTGSNGFAISGKNSASGNAMLYINPHVDFYFRPEVHVVSQEGLNVYGAVTWGQFFVYQGFNEYNGWMHTSSEVDVSDLYAETIIEKDGHKYYQYEGGLKPIVSKDITIKYKSEGRMMHKTIRTLHTHHGPVMSSLDKKLISVRSNNRSMKGLIQSWQRTKTKGFEDYKKVMEIKANTSNNTVYADNKGNIAYWHGNFIPVRDKRFNWAMPVDGSVKATEWKGLHPLNESVHIYNPLNGWLQNCNSTPFTVAGKNSPKRENYPDYMAPDAENFRGINAVKVFSALQKPGLDELIKAGYDRRLAAFEKLIPALVKSYLLKKNDSSYQILAPVIDSLDKWDMNVSAESVSSHIAIEWATALLPKMAKPSDRDQYPYIDSDKKTARFLSEATAEDLLNPLINLVMNLKKTRGSWIIPWGEVNRFQRISNKIELTHSDSLPSIPVPFASSVWGMLPSYASSRFANTVKRYGVHGNSFIAAVEFGKKIKAKSLLAGGQSGNISSPHFRDQAEMYAKGIFKDVLFYKDDVMKHAEKIYHPGED